MSSLSPFTEGLLTMTDNKKGLSTATLSRLNDGELAQLAWDETAGAHSQTALLLLWERNVDSVSKFYRRYIQALSVEGRAAAVATLGAEKTSGVRLLLLRALADPSPVVVRCAAEVMASNGNNELQNALQDIHANHPLAGANAG